jgi:hypothetical protein
LTYRGGTLASGQTQMLCVCLFFFKGGKVKAFPEFVGFKATAGDLQALDRLVAETRLDRSKLLRLLIASASKKRGFVWGNSAEVKGKQK